MMRKITCLFPGQGIKVDYSLDIFKTSLAQDALSYIQSIIGYDISITDQKSTIDSQLAIVYMSYVLFRHLINITGYHVQHVAGHSLGQFSAAIASGAISFEAGINLVYKRATYMHEYIEQSSQQQDKGIMIACIGDNVSAVLPGIITNIDGAYIANFNSHKQIVVSGVFDKTSVITKCKDHGIKCIPLPVAGAFHSPFMQKPNIQMNDELAQVAFHDITCGYICNQTQEIVHSGILIQKDLQNQMISSVYWTNIMSQIQNHHQDVDDIIEINASSVLSKFAPEGMNIHNGLQYINNFEHNELTLTNKHDNICNQSEESAV